MLASSITMLFQQSSRQVPLPPMVLLMHTLSIQVPQGPPSVARAPDAMEAVSDVAIPGEFVTTVVDAAHVVSGANSVTAADVREGEGVAAVRVACTSIFQVPAARQPPMGVLVSTLMMIPHKWFQVPMVWQPQMCIKVRASQLRVLPPLDSRCQQ